MEKVIQRKNGDTHIGATYNLDKWALPLDISWWRYKDSKKKETVSCTCLDVNIDILCFRFFIERWKFIGKEENEI